MISIITIFLVNFASTKPLEGLATKSGLQSTFSLLQISDLYNKNPLQLRKLIKRIEILEILTSKLSLSHPLQLHEIIESREMDAATKSSLKNGVEIEIPLPIKEMHDGKTELSKGVQTSKQSLPHSFQFHKLFKRMAVGTKSSPKTGFTAVTATTQEKSRKKTRKCLNWEKQHITGRWKCTKIQYDRKSTKSSHQNEKSNGLPNSKSSNNPRK